MPELSDRDYRALAEFRYALRVFLRFSEDAARTEGLTPHQHQLLLSVRGWPDGRPTIGDLAERLKLRHHSAVELVQRASTAGLVTVATDPADRRRQLVSLTPLGSTKLRSLTLLHRTELRRFRTQMQDVLEVLDSLA